MDTQRTPLPAAVPHSVFEDTLGLLTGCLFVALAVLMFRESQLFTGGTTGLAFVLHYLSGWPLGAWLFVVNLPFYVFAWLALGPVFTLKSFVAVGLMSLYVEALPSLLTLEELHTLRARTAGVHGERGNVRRHGRPTRRRRGTLQPSRRHNSRGVPLGLFNGLAQPDGARLFL